VPGLDRPANIDFSQFKVRGHYEDMPGYFVAMNWLSQVPLPMDGELAVLAARLSAEGPTPELAAAWVAIDSLLGAFMGRPVDATLPQVLELASTQPKLFAPFDAKTVEATLLEMRGPVPLRGTEGAVSGGQYPLRVTVF